MKSENRKTVYFSRAAGLLALIIIPVLLLFYFSLSYLNSLEREARLKEFAAKCDTILNKLSISAHTEEFVCRRLQEISLSAASSREMLRQIDTFTNQFSLQVEHCIWKADGDIEFSNLKGIDHEKLKQVFKILLEAAKDKNSVANEYESFERSEKAIDEEQKPENFPQPSVFKSSEEKEAQYAKVRDVLGAAFNPLFYQGCYEGKKLRLNKSEVSNFSSLIWLKLSENFATLVIFKPGDLLKRHGLKELLNSFKTNENMVIGFSDGRTLASSKPCTLEQDYNFSSSKFSIAATSKYYLKSGSIGNGLVGFCLTDKKSIDMSFFASCLRGKKSLLILFPFFILIIAALFLFNEKYFFFPIKIQFVLLFVVAYLLSGLVISIITKDYLGSYKQSLEQTALNDAIEVLKNCDDLFLNELTLQKIRLEKKLAETRLALKRQSIDESLVRDLLRGMKPFPARMYLVGSQSEALGTEDGVVTRKKILADFTGKLKALPVLLKFIRIMREVGQYYLKKINLEEVSFRKAYKLEAIVESLSKQKPIEQFLQFFEKDSDFWEWGFWANVYPSYIKTFRLDSNKKYDYTFLYLWFNFELQKHYLERSLPLLSKNESGLKVFAIDNRFNHCLPATGNEFNDRKLRKEFARFVQTHEEGRISSIKLNNNNYFIVSIPGSRLSDFYLLGLLSPEKINRKIEKTGSFLTNLFVACLLISILLSVIVSASILKPLSRLEAGAEALKERNFKFRVKDLGNNEFGKLGKILNNLLIDYGEIFNAAVVMEKLCDTSSESRKIGPWKFLSRSFHFSEAFSDFLHLYKANQPDCSLLFGTAEQRGIAANLILAFAKGALLRFENDAVNYSNCLPGLNKLFLKSNGKQAHQMAIAMLQVWSNRENHCLNITNAGFRDAILWENENLKQLRLPDSEPLGHNAIETFPKLEIPFAPGKKIMLFSAGFSTNNCFKQFGREFSTWLIANKSEPNLDELIIEYLSNKLDPGQVAKDLTIVVISA